MRHARVWPGYRKKSCRNKQSDRYQSQAAIAGLHSLAKNSAETDWSQIVGLYRLLLKMQPDPVVRLNYAVALIYAGQIDVASELLPKLEGDLQTYSPYWAARARLAEIQDNEEETLFALQVASELSGSKEELQHYRRQLKKLGNSDGDRECSMH